MAPPPPPALLEHLTLVTTLLYMVMLSFMAGSPGQILPKGGDQIRTLGVVLRVQVYLLLVGFHRMMIIISLRRVAAERTEGHLLTQVRLASFVSPMMR